MYHVRVLKIYYIVEPSEKLLYWLFGHCKDGWKVKRLISNKCCWETGVRHIPLVYMDGVLRATKAREREEGEIGTEEER